MRRDGRQGVMVLRDGRKVFQPVRVAASDRRLAVIAEGLATARVRPWTSR